MACRRTGRGGVNERERGESGKTVKEIQRSRGGCRLRGWWRDGGEMQRERERPLHPSWPPQAPAVFCADRTSLPGSHIQKLRVRSPR